MVAMIVTCYKRRLIMNSIFVSESKCFRGLDSLIASSVKHLENLGYRHGTIRNYQYTWKEFAQFTVENSKEKTFSTDLVFQFLDSCGISDKVETNMTFRQRHIRNVMHALTDFALHGCFQSRSHVVEKTKLPDNMEETLSGYEQFCREQLWSPLGTIRSRKRDITRFLHYLDSHGIASVKEIQASTLSRFVTSCAHLKPATLAHLVSSIRSFLRYLYMTGSIDNNMVERVPKIRVRSDEHIPSVWKSENVDALLAAVDRSSPCGKRDYAILLLAVRLGMRVSDIRNLRFENLLWEQARIEINQAKSSEPLALPLTEEIGNALIDYLRYGRPASQLREVFLRANAPFKPFGQDNNLHYIITRYRRRAAINLPVQNRKGMHSLRHTMASRLLEAGIPLETISGIMGHISMDTTRIYTKVNIEALQSVAIDPEEVTHA
jgi:site-specific recombinase XerD